MRWGKPTKNKKRRDPRYFLNESTESEDTLLTEVTSASERAIDRSMAQAPRRSQPSTQASVGQQARTFVQGAGQFTKDFFTKGPLAGLNQAAKDFIERNYVSKQKYDALLQQYQRLASQSQSRPVNVGATAAGPDE